MRGPDCLLAHQEDVFHCPAGDSTANGARNELKTMRLAARSSWQSFRSIRDEMTKLPANMSKQNGDSTWLILPFRCVYTPVGRWWSRRSLVGRAGVKPHRADGGGVCKSEPLVDANAVPQMPLLGSGGKPSESCKRIAWRVDASIVASSGRRKCAEGASPRQVKVYSPELSFFDPFRAACGAITLSPWRRLQTMRSRAGGQRLACGLVGLLAVAATRN
jgi:hypothetical protein